MSVQALDTVSAALRTFIREMPKVELHVHLEGAIQPETLLILARRNGVTLPADTVEGLREWYSFTDFPHFLEVYFVIARCIQSTDDLEFLARAFLAGQAAQNIRYSEIIFTPHIHFRNYGLEFVDQLAALNRARAWAETEFGIRANFVADIARDVTAEEALITADWAIEHLGNGIVGLGLGGYEVGNPPERFTEAFARATAVGVPALIHAGETGGTDSIWGAIRALNATRIEHGVRCIEDPALVAELRERQIPLDVAVTSNICLKVYPDYEHHPLRQLLDEGLYVTINSDDPPMFNTTLTDEYQLLASVYGFDVSRIERIALNAVHVALLPDSLKAQMAADFEAEFSALRARYGL